MIVKINGNTLYSISPITPLALIDTRFILIGVSVVLFAIAEKKLAELGFISIAEIIYKAINIALPLAGISAALYVISKAANIFL